MAFTFKPAVYDGTTFYELPRPIMAIRVQDAWDFEQFKVPLANGDSVVGHSRQGIDIRIEGQVGTQAGGLKISEADMFGELEQLRSQLDVTSSEDEYEFFLYHDTATATYRKLKSCSTIRFDYDLSNKALFTYSVAIHAEDPTIYTTSPGA
ncbi:MAG: hypothetical protein HON53_09210 [Planctomycetaceae bacterium]|jgi:hypothetical protein|nr:hypothetical protein [Planctomycetaceae bacterium]MBT6153436.1 hypothetical protein [Planctomycetaceae bacterium]MBT6484732.1 hypothetical protein [Planctomycetaceae bacterium]MBT6496482.1 hypothetical protein [Planctomycetaceae bacterium]